MIPTRDKPALRVVIVDDNRDAADTLAWLVQYHGHQARVAYDGLAGFGAVREERPDCVISDINMPGIDGYELAARVRADPALAAVKLVSLSANTGEYLTRAAAAGFDFRLTKPAGPVQLLEILAMLEEIRDLATQTQELARQNVELVEETKELLTEMKEDLREVKDEVRELKQDLREVKATRAEDGTTNRGY